MMSFPRKSYRKIFRAKFVFPEIQIASGLVKPIKFHEILVKLFKEKLGLRL